MHDRTAAVRPPSVDVVEQPVCCPTGQCGPVFETSLLELLIRGVRRRLDRRAGDTSVGPAVHSFAGYPVSAMPPVPAAPPQPEKDARND